MGYESLVYVNYIWTIGKKHLNNCYKVKFEISYLFFKKFINIISLEKLYQKCFNHLFIHSLNMLFSDQYIQGSTLDALKDQMLDER